MNITESNQASNYNVTGQFEGKPCCIHKDEGATIYLVMPREEAFKYIESQEYWALARAGIEVTISYERFRCC